MIDITFNFYSDSNGGDPDSTSPTLRKYHKILWSKQLPNGQFFKLRNDVAGSYLFHSSKLGEFSLGSDAITHSYKNHKRKKWLTSQIPEDVDELFDIGSTIGAYLIFPNKRIDGKYTINQARGVLGLIDDRFDLTLECIRRLYLGIVSPLTTTLKRYEDFFNLFGNFNNYVRYFLLNDLVQDNQEIKFYLPFNDFQKPPAFSNVDEYLTYKKRVIGFIDSRNKRIEEYSRELFSK